MQEKNNKLKPLFYSIAGAAAILLFWTDINRARDEKDPLVFKFINEEQGEKTPDADDNIQGMMANMMGRKYKDGVYESGNMTPWGEMAIKVNIQDGRWKDITLAQIPDSPPSYYAVKKLVRQALQAQSDEINGVSGATYASMAFRDDLTEIIRQSKL